MPTHANTAIDSPFARHESKLTGDYSTSIRLRKLVLNLYNDDEFPTVRLGALFCVADEAHTQAALEMIASYARYGENDPEFMRVGKALATAEINSRKAN